MAAVCGGRAVFWAVAAAVMTAVSGQTTEAAATCGTGPSVAATVFAILLLLALAALGIVMYQYIWKPRHCPSLEKVVLAENGQQEGRFAFDNPYMVEDDDIGSKSTLPCHDILAIGEKTGTSRSGDFRTPKKHGFCVLTPTSSQPRSPSADDSSVNEGEQVTVPLKGHDFTGLGFTVTGGMRDGIFVNTVSQHGPALESGLVQPGDRVTAVTVSFSHITLEDATAILSQSSPYNVQLHLQKTAGGQKKLTTPTGTGDRRHQSSTDLTEGKSHRTSRPDKSSAAGSPTSSSSSTQHERKTAVEKAENEPHKETTQHVQRDPSASFADSPSGGFREMAVDVPEHMDSSHQKQDTEASSGSSSTAKARHLGVQVLPPLTPGSGTGGAGTPGSEVRDGRRSVALGVPSLRLAKRDSTDSGHGVETCLTKLANDQPCSKDLDDETGEPSTPGAEEADHRRVRMGTSSFNKQERLARKDMDDQPDKPEPAKRQCSVGDVTVETEVKVEVEPQNDSTESDRSEVARSKTSDEGQQLRTSRDSASPNKHMSEKEGENEVEFEKLSSEFKTLIQEDKPQPGDAKPESDNDRSSAGKAHPRSRHSSSSSSSSSSSGRSSPVQERPKQMTEIPDEMRLAAGVAQDRRSRVDRPARSALFSSTEMLADRQKTPTEEKPTTANADLQEDGREAHTDQQTPPVAMPRTVTPDTHLSESRKEDSDSEEDSTKKESDAESEEKDSIPKKDDLDSEEKSGVNKKDDSGIEQEDSKPEVKDEKSSSSSEGEEDKADQPVEEEELKKTVRSIAAYQDDSLSSKIKIDKLEAFKEVLSLTPSKSPPEKRAKQEEEVDVVGEIIEKNHVDRCPCDGPTSNTTAPRITGEVTGLVEVGEKKSAKTEPVIVAVTESKPRPAEADERIAPSASTAVSRARSEAAALPEAVRVVRAVRRRDSGGPVAEVLSRDAAASGRLCASTGDLTRNEPPRADSPLGRTVSMHTGVGDQTDGDSRVSAAACARDQMDLSRLQEGYEVTQPRHIMSTASSNESLDTESIQEEPEDAADQLPPPPPETNNGANDHGPEEDDESTAPSAVPLETPSGKETIVEVTVNGIDGEEEHRENKEERREDKEEERSRHTSEEDGGAREGVSVPPTLPRIVQSELKRSSESDSSDGREELTVVSSPATAVSAVDEAITAPSVAPAVVAPPIVIDLAPEPVPDSSDAEGTTTDPSPVTILSGTAPDTAQSISGQTPNTGSPPGAGAAVELESTPERGAAGETGATGEATSAARSRRGPPPTPPPRSPASRQVAPPAPSREPDQFEISSVELDSLMISHEEFLRQEAERRAHVCRLAANFRSSREPSPAPE